MAYNLIASPEYDSLLEERIAYLVDYKHNPDAARHLLDEIDTVLDQLEDNPYTFSECSDETLKRKGYHKAVLRKMNYIILYRIDPDNNTVYIVGFFNELENYAKKI